MEWWVLVALAGIAMGAFSEWLKFKEKQDRLGASTDEINEELQTIRTALEKSEETRAALERRVQNLETIVTNEAWDALVAGDETEIIEIEADTRIERSEDGAASARQAERIARRLRG